MEGHLYSPETNLKRSELAQLLSAKVYVDVAMYSFTDREQAQELASLAQRGVRVQVYRDGLQFGQETRKGGLTTTSVLPHR